METPLQKAAAEIMECEFDNDDSLNSLQSIECWLESNVGALNALIDTSFGEYPPDGDCEAWAIYKRMYMHNYYSKKARSALRGVMDNCSDGSGEIISLKDGESRVAFANRNETAKVIRGLANDAKSEITDLVTRYNMYQSEPRQVGGIEAEVL